MTPSTWTATTATSRGTRTHNCDAAATHTHGTRTAAALVDGIGNSLAISRTAEILAEIAARIGARRGPLFGLLSAAEAAAQGPGERGPDGVAVMAVAEEGETLVTFAWTGDARAYGWDGDRLTRLTTDHTVGEYLRQNGQHEIAADHDNWVRTSLGRTTLATLHVATTHAPTILLTSDGAHGQVPQEVLEELLRVVAPEFLAEAIVRSAHEDEDGYRDDATVIVLTRTDGAP